MAINHFARAREAHAVDQAGVIEFVGKDDVVLSQNRSKKTNVRRVAATEVERGFGAGKFGEFLLERVPFMQVPGKQARTSAADSWRRMHSFDYCSAQPFGLR